MTSKKINVTKILLFLTILSLENFGYLLPSNDYLIPGLFKYGDIGIIIAIVFFIWVIFCVKNKNEIKKNKYPYKWLIISFIIIVLTSSIMAKHFFGQPIIMGIRSQRKIIACLLLYFPISKALQAEIIEKNDVIKDIIIIGTIELVLFTLQYILRDKLIFLSITNIDSIEMRLGLRRFRYPIELPLLSTFLCINSLLNKNDKKLKNIMYILWFSILLIFVVQKRTQILAFIAALSLILLLWKKNIGVKFLIFIVFAAFIIPFLFNSAIIKSTVDSIFNRGSEYDTLSIRESGIDYYKERVKDSPIFGYGLPNDKYPEAMNASGVKFGYYLADDGIFGFYYIFGISGIIWITIFWYKNIKNSYKLYKKKNYFYFLYFIYETIELYIGMKWYYYWPVAIGLIVSLLSDEIISMPNKKRS